MLANCRSNSLLTYLRTDLQRFRGHVGHEVCINRYTFFSLCTGMTVLFGMHQYCILFSQSMHVAVVVNSHIFHQTYSFWKFYKTCLHAQLHEASVSIRTYPALFNSNRSNVVTLVLAYEKLCYRRRIARRHVSTVSLGTSCTTNSAWMNGVRRLQLTIV